MLGMSNDTLQLHELQLTWVNQQLASYRGCRVIYWGSYLNQPTSDGMIRVSVQVFFTENLFKCFKCTWLGDVPNGTCQKIPGLDYTHLASRLMDILSVWPIRARENKHLSLFSRPIDLSGLCCYIIATLNVCSWSVVQQIDFALKRAKALDWRKKSCAQEEGMLMAPWNKLDFSATT